MNNGFVGREGKIILDLCGGTGSWSKPYREAGYDVRLITLPDQDVRTYTPPERVHGILAAPPCTEFSMAKNFHGKGNFTRDIEGAKEIVWACKKIINETAPEWYAIENPAGLLIGILGQPDYVFNPWEFGDNYQKTTCLWGRFNKPIPTVKTKPEGLIKFSALRSRDIAPEYYGVYDRTTRRAMTPQGFAKAFMEANP